MMKTTRIFYLAAVIALTSCVTAAETRELDREIEEPPIVLESEKKKPKEKGQTFINKEIEGQPKFEVSPVRK